MMLKVLPVKNFAFYLLIPGIASSFEGVMFSFALAYRYKTLNDESKAYIKVRKDMLFAIETQKRLFPANISSHNDYRIVGKYFPSTQMSGDFFDLIECHEKNTICILIADVAGHGYSAAIISAMVKVAFHQSFDINCSASDQIKKMNAMLSRVISDTFVTAGIFRINYKNMSASFAQAGHMPLVVLQKENNHIVTYKPPGRPLGISEDGGIWQESNFNLQKNDRIFLYTDGLTDLSNNKDVSYGQEKLFEFIRCNHFLSTNEFSSQLTNDLRNWDRTSLSGQEDDITFIVYDIL
jgi:serine phosphatase RsbU (regulator of sigma subunit)